MYAATTQSLYITCTHMRPGTILAKNFDKARQCLSRLNFTNPRPGQVAALCQQQARPQNLDKGCIIGQLIAQFTKPLHNSYTRIVPCGDLGFKALIQYSAAVPVVFPVQQHEQGTGGSCLTAANSTLQTP